MLWESVFEVTEPFDLNDSASGTSHRKLTQGMSYVVDATG
jgi:hypothetical protein